MAFSEELRELFANGHETYLRNISVDCIIFGFHGRELKVLLLEANYSSSWALPGGFIARNENIDAAAARILKQRTNLSDIYLRQFSVFGDANRATQHHNRSILSKHGVEAGTSWLFDRFVTVGYYALVDFSRVEPQVDEFSSDCRWFNVYDLPELMLDHRTLVEQALAYLRLQLNYHPIGHKLLPDRFTMPELQYLYESILGRKLDRRNFQRKILSVGILKRLEDKKKGVAHKSPYYYKFDLKKYQKALQSGLGFQL